MSALHTAIMDAFAAASLEQQVTMLETMPAALLNPEKGLPPLLNHHPRAWQGYLLRLTPEQLAALPTEYVEDVRTLLKWDDTPLAARIVSLGPKSWGLQIELMQLLHKRLLETTFTDYLFQYAGSLKNLGGDAVDYVVDLLRTPVRNMVVESIAIEKWSPSARERLAPALYNAMVGSSNDYFVEKAIPLLAQSAPELLFKYATHMLAGGMPYGHPLVSASEHINRAFSLVKSEQKLHLIAAMLASGFSWHQFNWFAAVVVLTECSERVLAKYLLSAKPTALEHIGRALKNSEQQPYEAVTKIKDVLTRTVGNIIEADNTKIAQLTPLLSLGANTFRAWEMVALMQQAPDDEVRRQLAENYTYPGCAVGTIMEYLPKLEGVAQTYAALRILEKIVAAQDTRLFEWQVVPLNAAMQVAVEAMCTEGAFVPTDLHKVIQAIPATYWGMYLKQILTTAQPQYRVRYAVYVLEHRDPTNAQALEVIATSMQEDNLEVQAILHKYMN